MICAGPGGVGKTTVAATIALKAATEGRRALVVTIDPAKRLANSLGLEKIGNSETPIGKELLARAGLKSDGELWAMMLDVKRTSDEVVARHAPSREHAERIYANRFYQTASTVLAGSQEYLAMEKLYELNETKRFDLIVLDTPPTSNALDFLDAPNRVLDVLSNDSLRWLATPALAAGKVGIRAVGFGSGYLIRQISKFTGIETLHALADFLHSMQGMYDGFKERAARVKALLASDDTSFVLVTTPGSMDEARFFHKALKESRMPIGALVVNRVHPDWRKAAGKGLDTESLQTWFDEDMAERLSLSVEEHQVLAEENLQSIISLKKESNALLSLVPILDRDVHDIAGLALMSRCLFEKKGLPAISALPLIPDKEKIKDNPGYAACLLSFLSAFIFILIITGCAGREVVPDPLPSIEIDEVHIVAGSPESVSLASLNDAELFQKGSSAFAEGDFEMAARAFSLLTVAFPESDLYLNAAYNAGFSWESMGEYLKALEYYTPLLDLFGDRDWLDTVYRIANILYRLEDFNEAARILGRILEIEELPPNDRIRALTMQGACLIEAGMEEEALHSLRSAIGRYHIERRKGQVELDIYFASRAQFHIGMIFHRRFERARLDPAGTDFETLADDLEHKAQLLLSAQGHYLRTIRMGEAQWATAAGHQIGLLYEELFRTIISARMPAELAGASERIAYMELLRSKVRVLLEKALNAYERTLSTAERIGVEGAWRERIEAGLERVQNLLLDDDIWTAPSS